MQAHLIAIFPAFSSFFIQASLESLGRFVESGLMPHGHCYLWQPTLVWLHVISDFLIGSAYVAISLALIVIIKKVKIPFSTVAVSFGLFIGACGATHFLEIWNLWNANYWLGGWVKAITAAASVTTALYLLKLRPEIYAMASAAKLAEQRRLDLEALTASLENRVEERTREAKAAEHKFKNTFDHAAIGIAHIDLNGTWLMANPRFCAITGYSQQELMQKTFDQITHPEDVAKDWEQANALARGEIDSYEMEKRYFRKSGEIIWVKLSVTMSRDENGEPEYFISCIDDISERKQLQTERERLYELPNHVLCILDEHGSFKQINEGLSTVLGFKREEMLGKPIWEFIHPDDLNKSIETELQGRRSIIHAFENRYRTKAGNYRWLRWTGTIIDGINYGAAIDITELKEAEAEKERLFDKVREALRKSELEKAKLINLFEQVPTPIAIYEGPEHVVTFANPVYQKYTNRKNLTGTRYVDAFPTAQSQGIIDLLTNVYTTGAPWSSAEFPLRLDGPDGGSLLHYINSTLQPYRNLDGEVEGIINLSFDVTEQVVARKDLERSERRLNIALEAATMGVWEWDLETGYVHWDERTKRCFGIEKGEFRNRIDDFFERIHPEDRSEMRKRSTQLDPSQKDFQFEFRTLWPDGSIHWIFSRGALVVDDKGHPIKMSGVIMDTTERKLAEEALRRSEETFRVALKNSPISVYTTDLELRYTWIHGAPRTAKSDVVLGKTDAELLDPESARTLERLKRQVLESGVAVRATLKLNWSANDQTFDLTIEPLRDINGHVTGLIGAGLDVSELANAKSRAEEASEAKTAFLANMSHEIRTPLGAMLGFAQLMLEDEQTTEAQKNSLNTIVRNGEQLYRIINELLDISKVEANKLEIERTHFKLDEVIHDVTSLLSVKAEQKGLAFNVSSEGLLPESIETDPTRFRQIMMNVIGNAIKFTEKGRIDVVFRLRDQEGPAGPSLEVHVEDTGIGISREQQARLFQPFTQADNTTTRRFGGTGLGLYLSRRFAQALGGDIVLANCDEQRGCKFIITIAVGTIQKIAMWSLQSHDGQHLVKGPIHRQADGRVNDVRVLVVDDSMDNLELTKRFLAAAGASVTTALGAQKAFDEMSKSSFDVVVMDIQMPEIDGYQAVRTLRSQGYEKPVVALTAHAMKGERERCLDAGFDGYLIKPIDRRALVNEIKSQAERFH